MHLRDQRLAAEDLLDHPVNDVCHARAVHKDNESLLVVVRDSLEVEANDPRSYEHFQPNVRAGLVRTHVEHDERDPTSHPFIFYLKESLNYMFKEF